MASQETRNSDHLVWNFKLIFSHISFKMHPNTPSWRQKIKLFSGKKCTPSVPPLPVDTLLAMLLRATARISYRRSVCISVRLSVRPSYSAIIKTVQARSRNLQSPRLSFVKDFSIRIRKAFFWKFELNHPNQGSYTVTKEGGNRKIPDF